MATFGYQVDGREAEQIRWYLEDYPEFPADPAPVLAADAEARLLRAGRRACSGRCSPARTRP